MPRMSDMPRSRKRLFSREDYLAPPAVPTGQPPRDMLNTIWRKNEVFLDIGDYSRSQEAKRIQATPDGDDFNNLHRG